MMVMTMTMILMSLPLRLLPLLPQSLLPMMTTDEDYADDDDRIEET